MKYIFIFLFVSFISIPTFSQIIYDGTTPKTKYPYTTILVLRNCGEEKRTITFESQINSFKNWVYGQGKMETNKVVQFSPYYHLDSNFIRQNIVNVRKVLPKTFWNFLYWGAIYENTPNQDSIWFMHLYVQIDKNNKIKIYAAYKITFEGTDATIYEQRKSPEISNVQFILDKQELLLLEKKLLTFKKAN